MATSKDLVNQINQAPAKKVDPNTLGLNALMKMPAMQKKFESVLKEKSKGFVTSVLNLVSNDSYLAQSNAMSIVTSAMVAATLDLPVDKNLGYAWIVPFKDRNHQFKQYAQFQLGYKGYIQLALRTGQYLSINAGPVYEGEIENWDRFTERYDKGTRKSNDVVGYLGYFELINGFKKTVYWTKDEMEDHRVKFNKAKDKRALTGVWKDNYDAMATKTVLRNLLSKWGILSIEMQQAITADESEIKDVDEDGTVLRDVTPDDIPEDLIDPTGQDAQIVEPETDGNNSSEQMDFSSIDEALNSK
jgi:recombination protein RecT